MPAHFHQIALDQSAVRVFRLIEKDGECPKTPQGGTEDQLRKMPLCWLNLKITIGNGKMPISPHTLQPHRPLVTPGQSSRTNRGGTRSTRRAFPYICTFLPEMKGVIVVK